MALPIARIGVHYAANDPYAAAWREVIAHSGLGCVEVFGILVDQIRGLDVLILAGYGEVEEAEREPLAHWVARGGQVICAGSAWGLEVMLGVLPIESMRIGRGRLLAAGAAAKIWPDEAPDTTFFGGTWAATKGAHSLVMCGESYVALSQRTIVQGGAWFYAPHVGQTAHQMQLGRSVECDGIGPGDGSAIFSDGICRAEDGITLDFALDRTPGEGGHCDFFGTAHADIVTEVFIRTILAACRAASKQAVLHWFWPMNQDGQAVLAIDCQEFDADRLFRLKQVMEVSAVPAAWLVAAPGYALEAFRMIRRWGDEVGLVFAPGENWDEALLRSQYLVVHRASGAPELTTVRPSEGKWRGYKQFYTIAEAAGARVSMSKSGTQPGTAGFAFGTSHPFMVLRKDGTRYRILEIPPNVIKPGVVTPTNTMHAIFRHAAVRHGCVTISLPSDFLNVDHGPLFMKQVFLLAQQYKFTWALPKDIFEFQRQRRGIHWMFDKSGGVELNAEFGADGLTVLVAGAGHAIRVNERQTQTKIVRRFGTEFTAIQVDIDPRKSAHLSLTPVVQTDAA